MTIVWIVLATVVDSLISLVGILTIPWGKGANKGLIFALVNFATGSLLGAAIFHLLPESWGNPLAPYFLLLGIILFLLLEKLLYWRHCHEGTECQIHVEAYTYLNLIGDGLHNFIDGAVIGGAFLAGTNLGWITTLAIIFHEIPQELGDFAILLHGGFSTRRALFFNLLSALTAIGGGVLTYFIGSSIEIAIPYILAFAAGNFLYIALVDLLPEMRHTVRLSQAFMQILLIICGIALMWGLRQFLAV